MKKVRVGILGGAEIARRYAIPAMKELDSVTLVAIASRSNDKATEWAKEYGLEAEDYDSLLARKDIDVIYSPLPVGLQEEWTLKAAASGKHVICEKSITYSLQSAKKMVNACKDAGVALYENFVPEFHPQHKAILDVINEGGIGKPRVWNGVFAFPPFPETDIRNNAELKGGALNDCGCYTAFMARKIMQAEPVAVTCRLSSESNDIDNAGSALFEFENGEALMSFGFDHMYQSTYSILGSKGMLKTNRAFAIPPTLAPTVTYFTNNGKEEKIETLDIPAANQFALSFAYFFNAVLNKDNARIEDMYDRILKQATVLEAMRTSAREGKRVVL